MQNYNIYLAGGMSDVPFEIQNTWRVCLKQALESCECNYNVKAINPVDYYSFEDDSTYDSELEIMNYDLHRVRNSDLVIVNFNSPKSLGTMAEMAIAYDRRIPIIGLNENVNTLHPWIHEMCSKIFTEREDLLEYVKHYYLN